jgi:hypothetical protein
MPHAGHMSVVSVALLHACNKKTPLSETRPARYAAKTCEIVQFTRASSSPDRY